MLRNLFRKRCRTAEGATGSPLLLICCLKLKPWSGSRSPCWASAWSRAILSVVSTGVPCVVCPCWVGNTRSSPCVVADRLPELVGIGDAAIVGDFVRRGRGYVGPLEPTGDGSAPCQSFVPGFGIRSRGGGVRVTRGRRTLLSIVGTVGVPCLDSLLESDAARGLRPRVKLVGTASVMMPNAT